MPKIIARKQDWLRLGYQIFAQKGISGIVIEKMAKKLKVNKSSFYWHFKTKKEFLDGLIAYWITAETEKVIQRVETAQNTKEKVDLFLKLPSKTTPIWSSFFG